ncbi:ArsR/SmtB family transcription factor [Catellatospora sichuanensis]|uniref:ArsR/SmtB family transcription factor n=1 Tax=Catellatospora sichuanensis TaxID=1969805 RepID=UPI0011841B15|nr:metalloregulator ArsR/SmtB family transcription factor [Catellatospora sichuanensis]
MGDTNRKAALFEQLARVGKAIGHGKRLELLDLLAQSERTVDALSAAAGLNLTTASAHLQTLKQAGLVTTRRDGTRIFYSIAGHDVLDLLVRARELAASRLPDVRSARDAYLGEDTTIAAVDRDDLLRCMQAQELTLVDVRPEVEYNAGHLPGAVNIPIEELEARLDEVPADREVVAYCRGPYCVFAYEAVMVLQRHGRRAARLTDGVTEWRLAGLPLAPQA